MKLSDITRLSSDYGMRKHPILKVMRMHNGIDLAGRLGTEIFSAADGKVTRVKYSKYGYGNQVIVEHSNGYSTRYAHLGNIYVDFGQEIRAGEQVGTLGSTGLSTGPHLHFEVIKDGASYRSAILLV
jgi:murein DD-endopeptidase MepM/ murein hydrolase activator NlpD